MTPKDELVGKYAVCHHGIIGVIEEVTTVGGEGMLVRGKDILTGENWQSVRPKVLGKLQTSFINEALAVEEVECSNT